MTDFVAAREKMVDCQVRTCDVTDHSLLKALLSVPREAFISDSLKDLAYIDEDLSLAELGGAGRYLMEPAEFAKLVQYLDVRSGDVVLTVGSGCGYSAAVFSLLASSVVAVEPNKDLVSFSTEALSDNGFDNVVVLEAEPNAGYPKEAPYDVIFVEGSIESEPEALLEQLADQGRLIAVFGQGNAASAHIYEKHDEIISKRRLMNCSIKPLAGFEREAEFTF